MNTEPDSRYSGEMQVDGKKLQLQSPADATLVQLMPVLKQLDPAMLAKVVEAKPSFAGAESGRMNEMRSRFNTAGSASPELRQRLEQMRKRSDNMRLARTDPDKALAAAATMSDPGEKAAMLADTASAMANKSPEDAAKVLDEAQKVAAEVKDQAAELRIVVASAQAARQLKQPQRVRELMARGFDLASQLISKQMDEHPESNGMGEAAAYMTSLVSLGIADDPDGVIAVIDAIPFPMTKAILYTTAARSMQWSGRGFRGGGFGGAGGGVMGGVISSTPMAVPAPR
jgi:hypothetical protein